MRRLALNASAVLLPLLVTTGTARAAELVYVHEAGCPHCRQWERQIGPVYDKTPEARRAALKPIEKRAAALADVKLARPVRYTPTFLLTENGVEVGRIEGYPGEEFFWALLGRLMDKLPADAGPSAAPDSLAKAGAPASGKLGGEAL